MTRNFHRWEVDPFFSAAEEVQDSTDRLESVYRAWVHMKSTIGDDEESEVESRRRELSIALGTAKWQLEEFERAVSFIPVNDKQHSGDDDSARHKQFVDALRNQITTIEQSLLSSNDSRDLKVIPVVHLDQMQKDELALFLCAHDTFRQVEGFPSMDRKSFEEAPYTTSESVKSKTGMSDCLSISASSSETTLNRVDFFNNDACDESQKSSTNQRHFMELCRSNVDLLSIKIEQVSQDPGPELSYMKGKRPNDRQKRIRSATDMNFCETRSENENNRNQEINGVTNSNFWSKLTKNKNPFSANLSRSGFKRYKDGDSTNVDKKNGSSWHAHSLASGGRGENTHSTTYGEAYRMSRWMHREFSSSRPLQIGSAILVTLALLGLSFHVSA